MNELVKVFETTGELAQFFTLFLLDRFRKIPADRHFSWVLAGGSTPQFIFTKVASGCRDKINWDRVDIFWGDERCVGPENEDSNYKMARKCLLDKVPIPETNVFRIQGELVYIVEADRYSKLFAMHVPGANGIPRPDLVMLGLGEDGHTASLFPSQIKLFNSESLFEPTEHPGTKQKRITSTGKVLNHGKVVAIIAVGEAKAEMAALVINRLPGWNQLPAGRICPENGELIWLLDKDAASKLTT